MVMVVMIVDSTMKGKCQTMLCFTGWKPTTSKVSKYNCNSLVFLVNSTSFLNLQAIYNQVVGDFERMATEAPGWADQWGAGGIGALEDGDNTKATENSSKTRRQIPSLD
ncbi:hypothetical protein Pyn_23486 [Prunus yedoensis var. nudiflora]|uniref:Uncharacterized protein n=1 Tax=Prunus yedoensis var. nudiflora TaxID=2094558 RepID=A0A314Z9M2_PRUYE|nr:hypothetical protein Pyn_23486 [Prunus yedoensis var. nudiflora]